MANPNDELGRLQEISAEISAATADLIKVSAPLSARQRLAIVVYQIEALKALAIELGQLAANLDLRLKNSALAGRRLRFAQRKKT